MKITVLKNFGLDGEDLAAGSVVTVNKSHFGDNEASFREGGFFEDFVEPTAEEPPVEKAPRVRPKTSANRKKPKAVGASEPVPDEGSEAHVQAEAEEPVAPDLP